MAQQLTLDVQLRDDATLDNFSVGNNGTLMTQLEISLAGQGERFFYLWGHHGVGRTHLLQACCHHITARRLPSAYIPLANAKKNLSLSLLSDLESLALVCIDNVESITDQTEWQEALFHLYNRVRESETLLIVTGDQPPPQMHLMPDLSSRLSWGLAFQIDDLSDEDKRTVLTSRAHKRGLILAKTVANFLLNHCSRNMADLFAILDQLDQSSLAEQRHLTIPFVKSVLQRFSL